MTGWSQQLRRAQAWLGSLPAEGQPDRVDVEFVVRLGVRDPQVLARLLWNDAGSLGRHFLALLDALEDTSYDVVAHDIAPQPPRPVDVGQSPEQTEQTEPPVEPVVVPNEAQDNDAVPGEDDTRYQNLAAYVTEHRAADPRLPWNDDWIARALADPAGTLEGLPSRVARKHRTRLSAILLESGPTATHGRDERGDNRAVAGAFSAEPDVHAEHRERHPIQITSEEPGIATLSWPAAPSGEYAHFKLIAGQGGKVPRLFDGNLLASTEQTRVVDDQPIYGAGRRHYAVWAYLGPDTAVARAARPVLWARGTALQPVQNLQMSVTGDDVSGTWDVAEGIDRVEVYRLTVPNDIPLTQVPQDHWQSGEVRGDNLTGFVDADLRAGEYEYRIYTFATVDGRKLRSVPIQRAATVRVPVPRVEDLQVEVVEEPKPTFEISWTPPQGQNCIVEIHLRGDEAPPGIQGRELDADGLVRNGFTGESRQSFPQTPRADGRVGIAFEWPDALDRVYVTAVTRLGAVYRVGTSQVRNRVGAINEARIVERVDEQFLTFGWPSGADFVAVHQGSLDAGATDPTTWHRIRHVVRERHDRYGGLHLPPLPAAGCLLALVGLAYHDAQSTAGEVKMLTYPGLTRLTYQLEEQHTTTGRWKKTEISAGWSLLVHANRAVDVPLVLVRNTSRLPLHHEDGDEVRRATVRLSEGQAETVWSGLHRGTELTGFIRLFVNVAGTEQLQYAVLDPAPGLLEWGH